jgi:ribonuclease PH
MMTRTLKTASIAAAFLAMPMLGSAADSTNALNSCVKAFMADLSAKAPNTRLVDSHYINGNAVDGNLRAFSSGSEMTLTARDAHDHHAVARAVCTVNLQGDVLELHSEPLSAAQY